MSKFCQNCGKALDDATRFCDGCGAPQQAAPQQAPVATTPKAPKASFDFNKIIDEVKSFANGLVNRCKADKKFMYTCIGVAAAAVVVLVVLLALVFGGSSYTAPIDTLIDVSFEGKVDKIKNLAPDEYWDWYEDEYDEDLDDIIEEAEESFDDMMEYYEEQYGDNLRVSYKVDKKKELSDRKLEGIAESVRFMDTKIIGTEDLLYNVQVFLRAQNAYYLREAFYHYRKDNQHSLTKTYKKELLPKRKVLFGELSRAVSHCGDPDYERALKKRIALDILGQSLNVVRSGEPAKTKRRLIREVLHDEVYGSALAELSTAGMRLHWKLYYGCAKRGAAMGVYLLTRAIIALR